MNRTIAPPIKSALDFNFHLPPINQQVLPNGIPLYFINDGVQEVAQLELVFQAGLWHEPGKGIAQATAALLKSGIPGMTSYEINETFEQWGVTVKAGAGPDWASVTLSGLSKHIHRVLPLLSRLLRETTYPEQELAIYIQNALQRLSIQLKKGDFVANRLIDTYLFGEAHPYGRYMHAEDYSEINSDDLTAFRTRGYHPGRLKIFLAGKFDEAVLQQVESVFGDTSWQTLPEPSEETPQIHAASERHYRVVNDAQSVQGAIRLASDFVPKTHPDFSPMIVLNTLFGGYFGSRLMSSIREEKGYTYGIHSYMYNHRFAGAMLITTEAGKAVSEATVAEIYAEMKLLCEELVDEEELSLVKNYLLGTILGDLDGCFQIIQRWKNLILHGFDENRFYSNIEIYKSVTPKQLQQLANTYYQPERFYELIVY